MDQMVTGDLSEVFHGRRVLVTGDTGFKGSWLCLWLQILGAKVFGYALPPERDDDHFNLLGLAKYIKHETGDIRDFSKIKSVFDEVKPEILFHLAAQPLVRYSYAEPKLTFDTNVAGSVNILEAVRQTSSLRAVVYVTSDKCYRNKEWIWGYRENDELGGFDPYSASKAAAEIVFSAYQDSFFRDCPALGVAAVRAGNVIGGGDWAADRIVPDSVRALSRGKPIFLRNPGSTRPWQHVLEPLSGYLLAAANLLIAPKMYSGPWNFGPDSQSIRTVADLAKMIMAEWGSGRIETEQQEDAPHEACLLHLNCDKAHQLLHWYPKWGVERAISETVSWYRGVLDGRDAWGISSGQIAAYMES
jgi:CDP-glucose 4,6-dehydratase